MLRPTEQRRDFFFSSVENTSICEMKDLLASLGVGEARRGSITRLSPSMTRVWVS